MDYLTSKQLAELLKVKHDTIRQWVARKKIKGIKIGNTWVFHKEEVERITISSVSKEEH